ncbi:uncharacterized protein LOC135155090 [Lytechinus pictus]|uniref:uncharacterized protein LOC135155090 n=1 Tax=Lytechinus pictus TaxID=7653 RepID=UPI0030BA1840
MTLKTRSRTVLEVVHVGPCSAEDLQLLSTQKIYIRPMQKNILLEENTPPANDDMLPCVLCGAIFLTSEMRQHNETCKNLEETTGCDEPLVLSDSDVSSAILVQSEPSSDDELPAGILNELPRKNEEHPELEHILSKVKERSSEDTSVAQLVQYFREDFIKGRRLNLPSDLASTDAAMQGDTYKIVISRMDVFQGVLDEFTATGYKPRLPLEVRFMGERGQDLGGIRKEFLRLALNAVYERLTIPYEGRILIEDYAGMCVNKAFLAAGIVIGQCIMQDGPKPNVLAKELVNRLVEGSCTTQSEQQLLEGMQKTGILELIRKFPKCRELLEFSEEPRVLESQELVDSFVPNFSEEGSNVRQQEEIVYGHFIRFIREVEAGNQHANGKEEEEILTLEHIVRFVTGLSNKPVCGWQPPLSVAFVRQDMSTVGIGASTCSHELHLPIPRNHTQSLPSRNVFFSLFCASFPDEFFGKD